MHGLPPRHFLDAAAKLGNHRPAVRQVPLLGVEDLRKSTQLQARQIEIAYRIRPG
jgi:hypothetical protein